MNRATVQSLAALLIGVLVGITLTYSVLTAQNPAEETTNTTSQTTITTTATSTTSLTATTTRTVTTTSTTVSRTTVTSSTTVTSTTTTMMSQGFVLLSGSFRAGATIPTEYTCDDVNVSPPLSWSAPPEGTESLVLLMDDPDAPMGTFTHWVLFNLPQDAAGLPEGVPSQSILEGGGIHGRNGMRQPGYMGPCPPPGPPHTYSFRIYAVDAALTLDAGVSKDDVLRAIDGHVLAQAELTGEYGR